MNETRRYRYRRGAGELREAPAGCRHSGGPIQQDSRNGSRLPNDEPDQGRAPFQNIRPAENGLREPSQIMVDKIATVEREKIDEPIGRLDAETLLIFDDALAVFVGLGD